MKHRDDHNFFIYLLSLQVRHPLFRFAHTKARYVMLITVCFGFFVIIIVVKKVSKKEKDFFCDIFTHKNNHFYN